MGIVYNKPVTPPNFFYYLICKKLVSPDKFFVGDFSMFADFISRNIVKHLQIFE